MLLNQVADSGHRSYDMLAALRTELTVGLHKAPVLRVARPTVGDCQQCFCDIDSPGNEVVPAAARVAGGLPLLVEGLDLMDEVIEQVVDGVGNEARPDALYSPKGHLDELSREP